MYFLLPHWVPVTWRSLAQTSVRAKFPSGNDLATWVLRRISRFSRSISLLVRITLLQMGDACCVTYAKPSFLKRQQEFQSTNAGTPLYTSTARRNAPTGGACSFITPLPGSPPYGHPEACSARKGYPHSAANDRIANDRLPVTKRDQGTAEFLLETNHAQRRACGSAFRLPLGQ